MADSVSVHLRRDCEALQIPSGHSVTLTQGTGVSILQTLGGHYTVQADANLFRIDAADADALGLINTASAQQQPPTSVEIGDESGQVDPVEVRRQLSRCYDPEIPVDILELGLVYRCDIRPHPEGGSHIDLDLTLTAPGCGMGAVLIADVRQKLLRLRGVRSVGVRLVFDPPWDASRMSEAAKLRLGLL